MQNLFVQKMMISNRPNCPRSNLNGGSISAKQCTIESISQKENAYHREHAVAQKNLKNNICVQRLSTDSMRTLRRLPQASLQTGPQNLVFLIFETSILLSKSQGWVTITTINLRVLEK